MEIEYDPAKRDLTILQRGLDMARCGEIFAGANLSFEDVRRQYGETRVITIGFIEDRMVFVVWTERDGVRRIISMRKANRREQATYRHLFG